MLDIHAVKVQLRQYLKTRLDESKSFPEKLERIVSSFGKASENAHQWSQCLEQLTQCWKSRKPSLLLAKLPDAPAGVYSTAVSYGSHACFAADGSQIYPDRHEIPDLALIQLGKVSIGYRTEAPPCLSSEARLLTPDILDGLIDNPLEKPPFEQFVTDERTADELETLSTLAEQFPEEIPRLALLDGSLIFWNLEDRPAAWRKLLLGRMRDSLKRLKESRTPIVAYISRPGGRDVVHTLAVYDFFHQWQRLPSEPAELFIDPRTGEVTDYGSGINDRILFDRILKTGQRSAWFGSSSHILQDYGEENQILFCYLRTENETARLEIPSWCEEYADGIHWMLQEQIRKGRGYPIALSEAHEKAVVRGADRELFYHAAREEWRRIHQEQGLKVPLPRPSAKQERKGRPLF